MRIRVAALCALVVLLGTGRATAHEVELRDGKRLRGHAIPAGDEVRFNPFGSTAPAMVLGERRLRARDVRRIGPDATPAGFVQQLEALRPNDVEGRVALLRWAQTRRLRPQIERVAAEILVRTPGHAEAQKALKGKGRLERLVRAHLALDPARQQALRRLIRLPDARARADAAAALAKRTGVPQPAHAIERMARSLSLPRGTVTGVPLLVGAEDFPGATYDRFVPLGHDPTTPTPLLVALHGGGIRGAKGTPVVGSGRDAMALFQRGAARQGWILVAPSAVEAPWPTRRNAAFVRAVLVQVLARWNIDLERIHVVGQGGGADGVWHIAGKRPEQFASAGVAGSAEPRAHQALAMRSALWMYHGAEDEVVPVGPVRKAAERLVGRGDLVYCELPDERHGFPPAAEADWFAFCGPRRRRKAASAFARSSFADAPTAAEIEALGDPRGAWGETLPAGADPESLLGLLRAGRFEAEPAARRLVAVGNDAGRREAVRALVRDPKAPVHARAWGAWLLGAWKDAASVAVVGDVLRAGKAPPLLRACAEAAGRIGSPDSLEDLRFALHDLAMRQKAVPGQTVPYLALEQACALGAALAEALGRVARAAKVPADEVQGDLEEALVIAVLRDRRRIVHRAALGEDPGARRAELALSLARAYRAIGADGTLFDLLRKAVKDEPRGRAAVARGRAEGLR